MNGTWGYSWIHGMRYKTNRTANKMNVSGEKSSIEKVSLCSGEFWANSFEDEIHEIWETNLKQIGKRKKKPYANTAEWSLLGRARYNKIVKNKLSCLKTGQHSIFFLL